uniref:Laminin EGF-like domain-containing protein n=1 Tax=Plectus sambesii TaxID=2011161 RepID=A0A914VZS4_9BILA
MCAPRPSTVYEQKCVGSRPCPPASCAGRAEPLIGAFLRTVWARGAAVHLRVWSARLLTRRCPFFSRFSAAARSASISTGRVLEFEGDQLARVAGCGVRSGSMDRMDRRAVDDEQPSVSRSAPGEEDSSAASAHSPFWRAMPTGGRLSTFVVILLISISQLWAKRRSANDGCGQRLATDNNAEQGSTRRPRVCAPAKTVATLVYKVMSPHIPTDNPYSDEIANLIKITNLRLNFTKLHTLGDDLLDYRPEIDEKYYYAIYDLVVRGSCSCYGHASRCIPIEGDGNDIISQRPDMVHGRCECTHATKGLNCEECQDFFNDLPWRPAVGQERNECRRCKCNQHAARCHFDRAVYEASGFVSGGVCDDCQHNTQGKNCEECKPYFYKDPQRDITDPYVCLPCQCDKSGSLNDGICEGEEDAERGLVAGKCYCKPNVDGPRCDRCKNGFWDLSAENPQGCKKCTCYLTGTYNNEGCDKRTGACTCKRLVTGENCDHCVCNHLGTNSSAGECDRVSGQCPCLPNVLGLQCDQCAANHYDLASGKGCSACACDVNGVIPDPNGQPSLQCNDFDGRCPCKPDRGGRTCSECQDYHWGDPAKECIRCQCDPTGSATQQCHRENGTCVCLPGSGGPQCNECARGYTGRWPHCQPCGECFQNWDAILQDLKVQTADLIDKASNIEDTGVASVYDDDFQNMEKKLATVREQLASANITQDDVEDLRDQMTALEKEVSAAKERLNAVDSRITETTSKVDTAEEDVKSLKDAATKLTATAEDLQENATRLRETDVEGAYNITRESAERSEAAKRRTNKADGLVAQSEDVRREAESLLEKNQGDFDQQFEENQQALEEIGTKVSELEKRLPSLNQDVCGAAGDPCDDICGGAGECGHCGGRSCLAGSVSKAKQALDFATEAAEKLSSKQTEAEDLLSRVRTALMDTERAKMDASKAFEVAKSAAQQANQTKAGLSELLDKINAFLEKEHATPAEIRVLSEEVLNTSISLTPEQIQDLADQIRDKLAKISNIEAILAETRGNLSLARQLKTKADIAKIRADTIQNTTNAVREALNTAKTAQDKARAAIAEANADIETTREDLNTVSEETAEAEKVAMKSNESLSGLEKDLKEVKVQYLQISEQAKNAYEAADKAQQQANAAEGSTSTRTS